MDSIRDRILNKGLDSKAKIILPEIMDERVFKASKILENKGFNIVDSNGYKNQFEKYLDYINSLPFTKNWPLNNLKEFLNNPINLSMTIVACGDADALVCGVITPSSDVIRSAIRIVGISPESNNVSSIFLMISPDKKKVFTFADCAVIPEPDSSQLSQIAKESAFFHKLLTGTDPIVAFLSFSTKDSASHYRVDKVKDAVKIFGKNNPEILHDGELQLDAAIIPEINKIKVPKSSIKGEANVLIFPNLDAGNIAYKLTQRLAGFSAWGPLLQGLNKPVHDLSRGSSIEDIVNVSAIAAMQTKVYADV